MANNPLPEGISLRAGSIVIDFRFRNQRCRETIKNLTPTKPNIRWAQRKRAAILHEIAQGTFEYADHFPDSNKAALFSGPKVKRKPVNELLDEWLDIQKPQIAVSSYRTYKNRANTYIRPEFGNQYLDEIKRSDIELWRRNLSTRFNNKTINEACLILRALFQTAKADRLIDYNPMEDLKNLSVHHDEPDPFTRDEIERILSTPSQQHQELNMVQFAFWSGVRLSELISLAWEDVDWSRKTIQVRRARVDRVYKVPKTRHSIRTIELTAPAIAALQQQRPFSEMQNPVKVTVIQADNKTKRTEQLRFIFKRTQTNTPFPDDGSVRERFWSNHLKRAQVRYRGPNHTRHTFVSQMLTAGMPKDWIAMQCGHTNTAMIDKHYGKWISEEAPNMASMANERLGLSESKWSHDGHTDQKQS